MAVPNAPPIYSVDSDSEETDASTTSSVSVASAKSGSGEELANSKRSIVWQHYTLIDTAGGIGKSAKCNYCPRLYSQSTKCKGSTGNLMSHLRSQHANKLRQNIDLTGSSPLTAPATKQTNSLFRDKDKDNEKFDSKIFRQKLLEWIVCSDQPFTEVQSESFAAMVKSISTKAALALPSRKGIKSDIIQSYEIEMINTVSMLQNIESRISFTNDCWTSQNSLSFFGITSHWIDKDWIPRSILLDFPHVTGTHSGENLCNVFMKTLRNFEIETKVLGVTMDNASNNDTFVKQFEARQVLDPCGRKFTSLSRVRCFAHVINLAVQAFIAELKCVSPVSDTSRDEIDSDSEESDEDEDGTLLERTDADTYDYSTVVSKLRRLVKKVRASPQRRLKLKDAAVLMKVTPNQPIIDCKTRWNSTYMMITRAIELKQPLISIASSEKALNAFCLNQSEWELLENLVAILQKFERATQHVSMKKYPIISSVIPAYDWLLNTLQNYKNSNPNSKLSPAINKAYCKLRDYYSFEPAGVDVIAMVLNPSLKLNYFKEHEWDQKFQRDNESAIYKIFEDYYQISVNAPANSTKGTELGLDEDLLAHIAKRSKPSKPENEMKCYLKAPLADAAVDCLQWWKVNETLYPQVSKMAKDYLAVQATSVPIEREFSGEVDLLPPTRRSMAAKTITACMCLKSWLKQKSVDLKI